MKRILSLFLALAVAAHAQVDQLGINRTTKRLNQPAVKVASGQTLTIETGGNIVNLGTATGFGISAVNIGMTVPNWLSITGTPVSTATGGTFAVGVPSQAAGLFLASPSGGAGVLAPRAIASADILTATGGLSPTTFANNAARVAATPTASGQIGFQLDNASLWWGGSLSAGDWNGTFGVSGFSCDNITASPSRQCR